MNTTSQFRLKQDIAKFVFVGVTGLLIAANASAAPYSDEDLIAKCRGEDVLKNVSVKCDYQPDQATLKTEMRFVAIGKSYTDNCKDDNDAGIELSGTFAKTKSWNVSGSVGLEFSGVSIGGGSEYGEATETSVALSHTFVVSAGRKAQAIVGQDWDISDGIMKIRAIKSVTNPGTGTPIVSESKHEIAMKQVEIPRLDTDLNVQDEEVSCEEEFVTPPGSADAFQGTVSGGK